MQYENPVGDNQPTCTDRLTDSAAAGVSHWKTKMPRGRRGIGIAGANYLTMAQPAGALGK